MKALQRIIKDRDHLIKEVEEAKTKIQTYEQTIQSLEFSIIIHEELIQEYSQIINICTNEKTD